MKHYRALRDLGFSWRRSLYILGNNTEEIPIPIQIESELSMLERWVESEKMSQKMSVVGIDDYSCVDMLIDLLDRQYGRNSLYFSDSQVKRYFALEKRVVLSR